MGDYPQAIVAKDHIEPVPRRVRAVLGGRTVVDTLRASYVWEWPFYPQYYVPVADVDPDALVDEDHVQRLHRGTARRHGLRVDDVERPGAALVYQDDAVEGLAGTVRFEWDALDAWFEEDEQVFVHPRNPYARVDALRSTRRVRIELEGTVLAESSSPVMVFETGLPTRYYLNRTEVDVTRLVPSADGDVVSLQGDHLELLVGPARRHRPPRPGLGLRLPDPGAGAHRRAGLLLQREGRRLPRRHPGGASDHPLLLTVPARPATGAGCHTLPMRSPA